MDTRLHVAFRTASMPAEQTIFSLMNARVIGLTPDARFAVLMDLLTDGVARNSPILLIALPDGQPVQIAEGYHPQVAPDGKSVVCLERRGSETTILLTPIPSGLQRRYRLIRAHDIIRLNSAELQTGIFFIWPMKLVLCTVTSSVHEQVSSWRLQASITSR